MNKKRILYIDDEVELLDLAESFFEEEDLPIDTSSNFQDALSKIRQTPYDLIISDAKMPSGCGFELFNIIKAEGYFQGKIILVTGNLEDTEKYLRLGYDMIIYKPIEFHELIQKIKSLLK